MKPLLRPVALLAGLVLWLSPGLAPSPHAAPLPAMGDGAEMSASAEKRMGERIARELYRDPDYCDDPILNDYVQEIWQPLLSAARASGEIGPELDQRFAWTVLLGRDRTINAFALPGGYFGVHLGLIAATSSRDELASVLGHELSHVTQRHIARVMGKQGQQAPWLMGAMILGALTIGRNADAGNALIVGGQALAAQNQLNFSRDMEREADRIGLQVMTQAGYDGRGFLGMFDKLQTAMRLNDSGAYPFLRSHPLTTERIADMQGRIGLQVSTPTTGTDLRHAMLQGRAKALSSSGAEALRTLLVAPGDAAALAAQPAARQVSTWSANLLAALHLRDFESATRARSALVPLLSAQINTEPLLRLWDAELELARGDAPRALALLHGTHAARGPTANAPTDLATSNRAGMLLAAQATARTATSGADLSELTQNLQRWVSEHASDASAWQALAGLYTTQSQPLRALRAEAEVQVARLDYSAALDRLRAAQDLARQRNGVDAATDHIESSIVDARRHQIEALLRDQGTDKPL
jgi:predicted Zn-dependent protease